LDISKAKIALKKKKPVIIVSTVFILKFL